MLAPLVFVLAAVQPPSPSPPPRIVVLRAAAMLDVAAGRLIRDPVVVVEGDRIRGKKVAAHAHGADGIKAALRAGVDSIEHGTFLDDEGVRLLVERKAWLVPNGAIHDMPAEGPRTPFAVERDALYARSSKEGFRKAVAAGVRIAMGSDSSVLPHGQNAKEIVWMARNGMTPLQV